MASYDYLIVGLGNPGEKYSGNRHNIGRMVANAFNIERDVSWIASSPIYLTSEIKYAGKKVLNCLPATYMNNSGEAVKKLANKYQIPPKNILIIVDEYNFPVGRIQLKKGGSTGGHNGIASVIEELGTDSFMRLRCGIGKDFGPGGMVAYVLSDFPEDQQKDVLNMIDKCIDAIECLLKIGFPRAMSQINSGKLWEETKKNGTVPRTHD